MTDTVTDPPETTPKRTAKKAAGRQEAQGTAGATLEAERQRRIAARDAGLTALRAAFPPEAIGKLPRSTCQDCSSKDGTRDSCPRHPNRGSCSVCGNYHNTQSTMHIDFVGHADVTDRLLSVDPAWTWEPAMRDASGQPSIASSMDRDGNLWINLTVLGVTRPGVGDGKNAKEKIGDALRNAAMRFGVALDLWAKGDRDWAQAEKTGTDQHADDHPAPAPQADPPWNGPTSQELVDLISQHAISVGQTLESITAKFREPHGLTVDGLLTVPPPVLAGLEGSIAKFIRENPEEAMRTADPNDPAAQA